MPSKQGQLRAVQPVLLEIMFEGLSPLIVNLEEPLLGVEEVSVTLEFNDPSELQSGHPVQGHIEGTALTLEVGNGVKIVGNLDNPQEDRPVQGFGDWLA